MTTDWSQFCRGADLEPDGDHVAVALSERRKHRVRVTDAGERYELYAVVARAAALPDERDVPLQAWLRNRGSHLVGFRVDKSGRLVGEGWMPKAGLTAEEFALCVKRVAAECDRFEFLLTGKDVE